jgi:hypothetical protein
MQIGKLGISLVRGCSGSGKPLSRSTLIAHSPPTVTIFAGSSRTDEFGGVSFGEQMVVILQPPRPRQRVPSMPKDTMCPVKAA